MLSDLRTHLSGNRPSAGADCVVLLLGALVMLNVISGAFAKPPADIQEHVLHEAARDRAAL